MGTPRFRCEGKRLSHSRALRHQPMSRALVRLRALLSALLLAAWSSNARADLIRIPDDGTADDPAATFDADCLGETQADDCDARAALIERRARDAALAGRGDVDPPRRRCSKARSSWIRPSWKPWR
jgi:hypothetical protein